ncbi:sodium/potassium-transporting ATPase subunit beta-3a [Conger conger]|uniref:sodium/potassium-transporting ATPase subunit beta-3a n=1 Tax=Conger conger TaxID=82655 RepID=UPI002A59A5B2|nr:sodium/potassium-transporting ATPase subunit beta-3a [Conger conger]
MSNPAVSNKEEKPEEQQKENQSSWKDFLYNPRTGEFVGRTASSWALIFLFYVVFYGFLAGMFTLTMWVMLQTLDDHTPKYRDRVSSPGLVIRPKSMDITFNRSDPLNYRQYVQHLESFLKPYNDTAQEQNELCVHGQYTEQDSSVEKKACPFNSSLLGQCSGQDDPSFGYAEGKPCVLVKMNRIIGLMPTGEPFINCTSKVRVSLLPVSLSPSLRFPLQKNYVQPLVAVKLLLTREDYGKELSLECKLHGTDLKNNDERDKFLGRVTFRVKVTE